MFFLYHDRTLEKQTALHLAAKYGHLQVTRYLAEQGGISPFVKTHKNETELSKEAMNFRAKVQA